MCVTSKTNFDSYYYMVELLSMASLLDNYRTLPYTKLKLAIHQLCKKCL